jgi:hypothetical protein
MLTTARERPAAYSVRSHKTLPAEAGYETLPVSAGWIQRRLLNPLRNRLPAGLIRRLLAQSASPLVAESLVRPGGWRSMEITYRNDTPVDFFDRLALRRTPMSLASRNRRKYVTATITRLIREFAAEGPVSIVGVGAGPGLHVQNAIVGSGVDPQRVSAYLIDLDNDAFAYGSQNARRLGIERSLHFLEGNACRIDEVLPHVAPQIVKIVGLAEYLSDRQLLELLRALARIMPPGGALVTHGLVDAWGNAPFLVRVFNLRHQTRGGEKMSVMLRTAGFEVVKTFVEPIGIFPILTARKPLRPATPQKSWACRLTTDS